MELVKTHKVCSKCKVEKTLDRFSVTKARCRDCQKEYDKIKSQRPEVKIRRYETSKEWLKNNPEKVKIRRDRYRLLHAEKQNRLQRESYAKNKSARYEWKKAWREKNPDKVKAADKRRSDIVKNNPLLKMSQKVRVRLNTVLKKCGYSKDSHTSFLLGISFELLKIYIERQFKDGMNWDNHGNGDGKWHLDHKMPLSSAKTEEELLKLFHYTNLQPLWAKENLSKGAKIIEHQLKIAI